MAKKVVATLREGKQDGRAYSKVIKMVKSPKTGAVQAVTLRPRIVRILLREWN